MLENLKQLIEGTEISEDTASKLNALLGAKLKEINEKHDSDMLASKQQLQEEIGKINEEHETLVQSLKEEHENAINEMKAKADDYGKYIKEEIEAEYETKLNEAKDEMSDKMDQYAQYVVESFIKTHKEQFVAEKDYKLMKESFEGIKDVFTKFAIETDPTDHIARLQEEIESRKAAHDEVVIANNSLKEEINKLNRKIVFEGLTSALADTQKERVSNLIESMKLKSNDEYENALKLMVEEVSQKKEVLTEDGQKDEKPVKNQKLFPDEKAQQEFSERMKRYLDKL